MKVPDLFIEYAIDEERKLISIFLESGHLDTSLLISFIRRIETLEPFDRYAIEITLLDTVYAAHVVPMGRWMRPEGDLEYTLSMKPKN
jgi:hypothetical protein